ncbi:hypothetical protein VIBNIPon4_110015 [Vibrio nigripulchritudo POn4]|nr:hypothetical protein VIBNIAM115_1490003 [Vibrio nigripulchritudo AM115]CCN63096.1 hypothetical protein VIBNIPon4_110015 [Vibrio nigripulchritudo POn4]
MNLQCFGQVCRLNLREFSEKALNIVFTIQMCSIQSCQGKHV